MRRAALLVLMISLLCFTGCSNSAKLEQQFEEKREEFTNAQAISFVANITANLQDNEFSCQLKCTLEDGSSVLEVLSPAEVSGTRIIVGDGETALEYQGVQLYVGNIGQEGLSPISALPMVTKALIGGFVDKMYGEKTDDYDLVVADFYESDTTTVKIWFSADNYEPVYAEIIENEVAVLRCSISQFALQ